MLVPIERRELLERADEGDLRRVLRRGTVVEHAVGDAEDDALVPLHQDPEGGRLPLHDLPDEDPFICALIQ